MFSVIEHIRQHPFLNEPLRIETLTEKRVAFSVEEFKDLSFCSEIIKSRLSKTETEFNKINLGNILNKFNKLIKKKTEHHD